MKILMQASQCWDPNGDISLARSLERSQWWPEMFTYQLWMKILIKSHFTHYFMKFKCKSHNIGKSCFLVHLHVLKQFRTQIPGSHVGWCTANFSQVWVQRSYQKDYYAFVKEQPYETRRVKLPSPWFEILKIIWRSYRASLRNSCIYTYCIMLYLILLYIAMDHLWPVYINIYTHIIRIYTYTYIHIYIYTYIHIYIYIYIYIYTYIYTHICI